MREYPDPHCSTITKNISAATGSPEDWIRVTNGSTEMIYLLPHLIPKGQEVAILDPCFSEYEKTFVAFGVQPHSPNSRFPEAAMAGALGVRLEGTNFYSGKLNEKPFIGDNLREPELSDIT